MAVFVVIIVLIFRLELLQSDVAVSPQETTLLMNREHYIVIDIRAEDEFKKEHIRGAKHHKPDFPEKNNPWLKYKKKKVVIVCSDGRLSSRFANKVKKELKNENVKILRGGLEAWKSENYPLAC